MRILYVRNLNQVAAIQARELARRNHFVKVYQPSLNGNTDSLPIKLTKMLGRTLSLRRVVGELDTNHFDLAHIHWASYGILGLTSRIPFIVECHGSDVRYRLKHPFFRLLLSAVFHRSAGVHCITPDLVPIVQAVYPRATYFPGLVDTEQFAPAENTLSSTQPWTILFFTRLDPIKGPDIATEGLDRFSRRHPNVRVQLLDWGMLKEYYKQKYEGRFEFISPVPYQEVHHLLRSADVVVGQFFLGILSFCELQAMSCAKPVICPFHYEDAYPMSPPLCHANTAEDLDTQLEYLFQHPEDAKALGQQARAWIIKHHDSRSLSTKLETEYQSIVENSR